MLHPLSCTRAHQLFPDQRPEKSRPTSDNEFHKQPCFGEGTRKTEVTHRCVFRLTGLEHCASNQAQGDHVHEEFLVKRRRGMAMPGSSAQGVFEIPVESLDIPVHVIELGQFRGGIQRRIQK